MACARTIPQPVMAGLDPAIQYKRWPRKWKLDLIEKMNPEWEDLYLSF